MIHLIPVLVHPELILDVFVTYANKFIYALYFFQTNGATTKPHRNKNETLKPHLKTSAKNDTFKV